jgi:predicted DNA-binding transcriptional regulator YafY
MKAGRLLSILLLLQARGRLTGRELAERLEVSGRTVHRDLEALGAAGVPVFALRGARGGWQLEEDWRTRVPGLDEAELRALLMAQPRVIGDPRLAAAAERALGKLMAALPVGLRERAASIRQRLYVDATGWRVSTENFRMLPIVQDAISRDRQLAIRYRRAEHGREERTCVERVVDPLGLVAKGSTWYLVAGTVNGFRTFRVSRMESAVLLDSPSQRPPQFDLEEYWKSSTKQFQQGWRRYVATLRLSPRALNWVRMWGAASPVAESESPSEDSGEGAESHWVTLEVEFDHEEQACFVILGLGARVDVIEPASLRERAAAELAAVLARRRNSEPAG